jgi:hypothetical protein
MFTLNRNCLTTFTKSLQFYINKNYSKSAKYSLNWKPKLAVVGINV